MGLTLLRSHPAVMECRHQTREPPACVALRVGGRQEGEMGVEPKPCVVARHRILSLFDGYGEPGRVVETSQEVQEVGPSQQNGKKLVPLDVCTQCMHPFPSSPRDIREQMQKQVEKARGDPPFVAPSSLTGWVGIRGIALFLSSTIRRFGRQQGHVVEGLSAHNRARAATVLPSLPEPKKQTQRSRLVRLLLGLQ